MAIRHDYLQKLEPDKAETQYVDVLLDGWSSWSCGERGPNPPIGAGALLHIATVRQGFYKLKISDDEFTLVDARVATLPARLREIVELEYRHLWRGAYHTLSQEAKWRLMGLRRTAYTQRLAAAQWVMHASLLPHVERWRLRNL